MLSDTEFHSSNHLVLEFQGGVELNGLPVSQPVLVYALQEITVVFEIPVAIKMRTLDVRSQLKSSNRSTVLFFVVSFKAFNEIKMKPKRNALKTTERKQFNPL